MPLEPVPSALVNSVRSILKTRLGFSLTISLTSSIARGRLDSSKSLLSIASYSLCRARRALLVSVFDNGGAFFFGIFFVVAVAFPTSFGGCPLTFGGSLSFIAIVPDITFTRAFVANRFASFARCFYRPLLGFSFTILANLSALSWTSTISPNRILFLVSRLITSLMNLCLSS